MIVNLQVVRGIAALLIVFDHWADAHGGTLARIGLAGATGVDLFFVVSGFVMVYTTTNKPVSALAFAKNRIVRIAPLYWGATIFAFLLAAAAPALMRSTSADPIALLKSLAFIAYEKSPGRVYPVLFPGWTLNYEMFFYAIFAASLLLRDRAAQFGCVLLVILGCVSYGAIASHADAVTGFYTAPILLEFGYGMVLALLHPQIVRTTLPRIWLIGLLIVGAAALLGLHFLDGPDRAFRSGLPAAGIIFCVLALEARGIAWRAPAARLLGEASYALYILHPFAVAGLFKLASAAHLNTGPMRWIAGAVIIGSAVAMAIGIHWYVERPVHQWLRARLLPPGRTKQAGKQATEVLG